MVFVICYGQLHSFCQGLLLARVMQFTGSCSCMWQQPLEITIFESLPPQSYVRLNRWPFYLSWFLSFGMIIAMGCSERLRKKYPINYLFLVRGAAAPDAQALLSATL